MITIFLPIRKGSQRVKNKNFRRIKQYKYGLLEIKIKQFLRIKRNIQNKYKKFKNIEFVVSTNCKKTIEYLKKFSWIKVFQRSEKLSSDDCLDLFIKTVPKICSNNHILWTHVTSPCFDAKCYIDIINKYFDKKSNKEKRSMYSADKIKNFLCLENGKIISKKNSKKKWPRTQDLKTFYIMNSAAFINSKKNYFKFNDRLCNKPLPYFTKNPEGFDIDDLEDFTFFRKYLCK